TRAPVDDGRGVGQRKLGTLLAVGLEGDGRVRRVSNLRRLPPHTHLARLDWTLVGLLRHRRLPTHRFHVPRRQLSSAGYALLRLTVVSLGVWSLRSRSSFLL